MHWLSSICEGKVAKRARSAGNADELGVTDVLDPIFRDIILQSPISTWIADEHGTNIFENAACRRLFGIDKDEQVVGKYNLFEDEELRRQGFLPEVRKVFEEGVPIELVIHYDFSKVRHVDVPHATRKYLRAFLFPIKDASGKVSCVVIQHEDYTEKYEAGEKLRESEERYRRVVQLSPDAIVVHSEGRILFVNAAGAALLGVSSHKELVGKSVVDFVHADYRDIVRERIRLMTEKGQKAPLIEEKFVRSDGTTVDVEVAASPLTYQGKKAVLVVARNITDRKQTEQRRLDLEELQRQFYRQTILAATGGKLVICEHDEIARLDGDGVAKCAVRKPSDMSAARHRIKDEATAHGMPEQRADNLALCAGEAATNALKHAGGGEIRLLVREERIFVCVSDRGPGMDALILPRVMLELGYSTGASLGMGYAIILALSDQVLLATGPAGTTVAIAMNVKSQASAPSVEALPDTW